MKPKQATTTLPQFKLKSINADFEVDEIYLAPPLCPKEVAEYTHFIAQKENLTSFSLMQHLADFFNLSAESVSVSGLKDEQAITRQLVSTRAILSHDEMTQANQFFAGRELELQLVQFIGYSKIPAYPRTLHGNKFTIVIRELDQIIARRVEDKLKEARFFTFINYYDEQRFGLPGSIHNTYLIGKALLEDNWEEAYRQYLRSGIDTQEAEQAEAGFALNQSYQEPFNSLPTAKLNFFVSSYNSYLWNKQLQAHIAGLEQTQTVEFPDLGAIILPTNQTEPLPPVLSIEVEKRNWQTGARYRDVKIRPVLINVPIYLLDRFDDGLHGNGKQALKITFYLPTGCYATMLVKQLLLAATKAS